MADDVGTVETDEGPKQSDSAYWLRILKSAEKAETDYQQLCDKTDDRLCAVSDRATNLDNEMQVFWANLEVLKPTLYSRPPKPVVTPRFGDRSQIKRVSSDILERALTTFIDVSGLHETVKLARDDLAVNARGAAWLRLEGEEGKFRVVAEHVSRHDFRHGPARKWEEVPWVARASYLTKKDYEARFGKPGEGIEFKKRDLSGRERTDDVTDESQARVWEVWHRALRKVVWVADGAKMTSDESEPLHSLDGFWPCPRPAYGTLKRETLTPVPDVAFYADQLDEINELTDRIAHLTDSLRLKGFYSAGGDLGAAIEVALSDLNSSSLLVPIRSTETLGGPSMKDAIVWLPIEQVALTLRECVAQRAELMQAVYEITGLSDIMRGATEASETLGAQQLKAQFGSVRVRERQADLQRFAKEILAIAGEMMAESFDPQSLLELAQTELPSQQEMDAKRQEVIATFSPQMEQAVEASNAAMAQGDQEAAQQADQAGMQAEQQLQQAVAEIDQTITIEKVMAFLRDEHLRPLAIDVESDSTIQPDRQAEKQSRSEFIMALGPLIQQGVQAMQLAPQLGPFIAETIRFVAGGFDVPRSMEDAIDDLAEGFANYEPPQQQNEGGGEAEAAKAQADMMKAQMEMQIKQQMAQIEAQSAQMELQVKQRDAEIEGAKAQAEIQASQQEAEIGAQSAAVDIQKTRAEIERIEAQTQAAKARPTNGA